MTRNVQSASTLTTSGDHHRHRTDALHLSGIEPPSCMDGRPLADLQ
ncbi:MAG: hypothetical protein ACRD2X_27455 [Vicinamibacteraceae bacterium]